jgi:predicted Zn-dependent peptidase
LVRTCALENHALLLLEDVSSTDTVSIGFWLKNGSRDEKDGERGFSHFLEHMLFKGTERRNAFEIARSIDRVGGILNAFTENELTCFYCTLPVEHIDLAVDILTDMVFHSVLDPMELEKEKSVILNEVLSYMDMPEQLAHEVYLSNMWGNHPLAMKITGEIGEIKAVTLERLESFYRDRPLDRVDNRRPGAAEEL